MNSYSVKIYHVDDDEDDQPCDRLTIHLSMLAETTVDAEDEKMAATKAWIETVGQARKERLDSLNAPEVVRNYDVSEDCISRGLTPCSLCPTGTGFLLDNKAEAWLIGVESSSDAS